MFFYQDGLSYKAAAFDKIGQAGGFGLGTKKALNPS